MGKVYCYHYFRTSSTLTQIDYVRLLCQKLKRNVEFIVILPHICSFVKIKQVLYIKQLFLKTVYYTINVFFSLHIFPEIQFIIKESKLTIAVLNCHKKSQREKTISFFLFSFMLRFDHRNLKKNIGTQKSPKVWKINELYEHKFRSTEIFIRFLD